MQAFCLLKAVPFFCYKFLTNSLLALFKPLKQTAVNVINWGHQMRSDDKARLEVRLAETDQELEASQALRYRVFYEEGGAQPSGDMVRAKLDFDTYDKFCDHLLVIDHDKGAGAKGVVGTYRMLRASSAEIAGGFYSADEYDLDPLIAGDSGGEILELGRSCVDKDYRTTATMQLLWQGIAAYTFRHDIKMLFGCASLPGTDLDALTEILSYLHHHHLAPETMRPRALAARYQAMDRSPADAIDPRKAIRALPPLIKGYLRLGGYVGDGAVVDYQFNTTDVCIIVPTEKVTSRYLKHYERKTGQA